MYSEATVVSAPAKNDKTVNAYLGAVARQADRGGKALQDRRPVPVKQFWSVTVYDRATWTFIYSDSNRTTRSSYDLPNMKKNADGSVTLHVGPKAPDGLEANWIPTRGKWPIPRPVAGLLSPAADELVLRSNLASSSDCTGIVHGCNHTIYREVDVTASFLPESKARIALELPHRLFCDRYPPLALLAQCHLHKREPAHHARDVALDLAPVLDVVGKHILGGEMAVELRC
jgi:hypothetical protein